MLPICVFHCEHYAPINVNSQGEGGGGGGADPGEFDILIEASAKFCTPGYFPSHYFPGVTFFFISFTFNGSWKFVV